MLEKNIFDRLEEYTLDIETNAQQICTSMNYKFQSELNSGKGVELIKYYQAKPHLRSYTFEKDLHRMKYCVKTKNGDRRVILEGCEQIKAYFQQNKPISTAIAEQEEQKIEDILWRAANQSLLADAVTGLITQDGVVPLPFVTSVTAEDCSFLVNLEKKFVSCDCSLSVSVPVNNDPTVVNIETDFLNPHKKTIDVIVPLGQAGFVIQKIESGDHVFQVIKHWSCVADRIKVGDKLVAVDDVEVLTMTSDEVRNILTHRSTNSKRKLTVIQYRSSATSDPSQFKMNISNFQLSVMFSLARCSTHDTCQDIYNSSVIKYNVKNLQPSELFFENRSQFFRKLKSAANILAKEMKEVGYDKTMFPKEIACSPDEPKLLNFILQKDWEGAIFQARSYLKEASMWSDVRHNDGRVKDRVLPLHQACVLGAPVTMIDTLLLANPEAIREKQPFSQKMPLHISCMKNATPQVIRTLLSASKQSAKAQDSFGRLPLHYAVFRHAPIEVVDNLLAAYPEGAQVRDKMKWLPIHIACRHGAQKELIDALVRVHPKSILIVHRELHRMKSNKDDALCEGNTYTQEEKGTYEHILSSDVAAYPNQWGVGVAA